MEDYEKKYKEALELARDYYKANLKLNNADENLLLEDIFPELAKSEDDKIREMLIDSFTRADMGGEIYGKGVTYKQVIAWLEKQGKSSDQIHYWTEEEIEPIINDYLRGVEHYGGMIGRLRCLKPKSLEKHGNYSIKWQKNTLNNKPAINHSVLMKTIQGIAEGEWQGEHWFQYRWSWTLKDSDVLSWMELSDLDEQGEQKPVLDFKASNWYVSKVDGKIHDMTYNPTNKIKPKFKVGDYIVSDYCTGRVIEITSDAYLLDIGQGIPFSCEYNVHLWTIQDAKDGDMLIDKSGSRECPFIFKETKPSDIKTDMLNPLAVLGYCGIGGAGFTKGSGWGDTANCIYYPATKEQRDLLFQKMKEAGYEWDAEKKKLRKIKPIWGTVDLELPSGTLWATMNVGATSETDYGLHFAWGDTQGYTSSQVGTGSGQKAFSWNDYVHGTESNLTKYNLTDGLTTLELTDDAAYSLSNGQYAMPTKEQFDELIANTTSSWDSARSGYIFTSKVNGNSIFFPAAGGCFGGSVDNVESFSFYWASSLDSDSVECSCGLSFDSEHMGVYCDYRCSGYSVRGVIKRKFSLYV